jgi:hypothetical protein
LKIVIIVKILRSLKLVLPDFKDLNISILFFSIIYGKAVQVPYNTGISWLAENLLASQQ